MTAPQRPLKLTVLLSGGGRTMVNLQEQITAGTLNAEIVQVISSRSSVAGVEQAEKLGIEPKIIRKKDYQSVAEFSDAIINQLDRAHPDLVVQCGWLCLWRIPDRYAGRVMNIHPALLPSFGGKGMWGHHVHQAVLDTGCKVSGCTVHFVTNIYDQGPIIIQRTCPVCQGDDADMLGARVFDEECKAYPEAISLFAQGALTIQGPRVRIETPSCNPK